MLELLGCSKEETIKDAWKKINYLKEIRNSIIHNNSITNISLNHSDFKVLGDLILCEYSELLTIDHGFFEIKEKAFHYNAIENFKEFFHYLDLEVKNYATQHTA